MEIKKVSQNGLPLRGLPKGYQEDVKVFNRYAAGKTITGELILSYFDYLKDHNYRPSTIQRHKAALKKAVSQAMGKGATIAHIAQLDTFFQQVKPGKAEKKVLVEHTLTIEELTELTEQAGEKTELIIRSLYQTACRVSELVNIRIADCKVSPGGVMIRIMGKGKKERTVFMTAELFQRIQETYGGEEYLFETNGRPLNRLTVYTMIKRAGRKIGRPDIHPHTIRHSFSTIRLRDLGIDALSDYLGHSSPEITARYYLHKKPSIKNVLQGVTI